MAQRSLRSSRPKMLFSTALDRGNRFSGGRRARYSLQGSPRCQTPSTQTAPLAPQIQVRIQGTWLEKIVRVDPINRQSDP
ncbi:hypothetical protein LshimejAT787_0108950 [Lyophyllum shimeji]|uniref:Uncharacterized protein n=1 Tax=Lyophyllum shimeji TaxID=47721 RepID=A0A9P3PDQ9_LYOSH|nr:hypothetical protein LshimejAT787_0108950 [Lyophyllum shimeji]